VQEEDQSAGVVCRQNRPLSGLRDEIRVAGKQIDRCASSDGARYAQHSGRVHEPVGFEIAGQPVDRSTSRRRITPRCDARE
jgi:hypothetical protein